MQVRNYFNITGRRDVAVQAIAQDKRGFLWIGTAEGLYRFDGLEADEALPAWVMYQQPVTALHVDDENTLWIGTAGGKIYKVYEDQVDSIATTKMGIRERITSFYTEPGLTVAGSYGQGLLVIRNNKTQVLQKEQGLSDNVVYTVTGDQRGNFWCGTDAGITAVIHHNGTYSTNIISSREGLPDNIVRSLRFNDDSLHIAMQDSGVCFYDLKKKTFTRDPFFASWSLGAVLLSDFIGEELYTATEREGLIRINDGNFALHPYDGIGVQRINTVFIDNTRQVWIGSNRGLSKFSERKIAMIGPAQGAPEKVLALAVDNNNVIWTGAAEFVSKVMYNDKARPVVQSAGNFRGIAISCAARGPEGRIWFGTYGSGLLMFDPLKNKVISITSKSHGLPNDNISCIHFDKNDVVYISTLGGGLATANLEDGVSLKINAVYNEGHGLGSNYVYQAITDQAGRLYAATDGGGLELLRGGSFVNLTKKYGYGSNSVFSLCVDRNNTLWAVSNDDGILRYDERGLKSFAKNEGLRDEQPSQIIAAGDALYSIHGKGIDRINTRTGSIIYYDLPEPDAEPNLNAVFLHAGKIYSGTQKGILVIRALEHHGEASPTAFLRSVTVNFRKQKPDSTYTFGHSENNFAFNIAGVWLKEPDKLSFRYMLRGLDKDWQTAEEGKTVSYNNLRPGQYVFVVQSKNEDDVWSSPATFTFEILPPLWQRWWFWALVIAFIAAGIYLFIQYRLKSLQKENLILESRVRERTQEIAEQNRIIENKNRELELLSLVASKTDNVVLILNPDGKLEYVNESFIRQHNMSFEEVKSKYGETIYELSNNPNIKELVSAAIEERKSITYESLNKKEEAGRGRWQASTLTPIFGEDGSLRKLIIIDSDVTERKMQEQIILQKNKDITDSINYAKKIQHTILPAQELIRQHIPDHFILYITKDIVSGDFYWFTHTEDFSIIAAVDCTGHGVPGAFMSLIGYNLLDKIVNEDRHYDPGDILLRLNQGVVYALHKNESESRDGMDIAICKINHKTGTIEYSGAMRPLWLVRGNELQEVKPSKIPIGRLQKDRDETIQFQTHTVEVQAGDKYYIFTDGYADQFGGSKDKKYSTARFKNIIGNIAHMTFEEQERILKDEHLFWKGDHEQIDDILVIGFSVKPPAR